MTSWWYAIRDERIGPLTFAELSELVLEKKLATNTLVWRNGWPNWQRADEVDELRAVLTDTPPPLPSSPSPPAGGEDPPPLAGVLVARAKPLFEELRRLGHGAWLVAALVLLLVGAWVSRRNSLVAILFGVAAFQAIESRARKVDPAWRDLIAFFAAYIGWAGATTSAKYGLAVLLIHAGLAVAFALLVLRPQIRSFFYFPATLAASIAVLDAYRWSLCRTDFLCNAQMHVDSASRILLLVGIAVTAWMRARSSAR